MSFIGGLKEMFGWVAELSARVQPRHGSTVARWVFVALLPLSATAQQTVFISDFYPRYVQPGDVVTVIGSGFATSPTPPTHADVGGFPSTPVRVRSDTELEFDVQPLHSTDEIWLRNINARGGILNVAVSTDRLTVAGTPSAPPIAPSLVRFFAVSSTELEVRWHDNAFDETLYEAAIYLGGFSGWQVYRLPPDTDRFTFANLQPGQTYPVMVTAYNQQGRSSTGLVISPALPKIDPSVADITITNLGFVTTLEPGAYRLKAGEIDALHDGNATGVVELVESPNNLQRIPDPNTVLFPMQSRSTPSTNPPWTSFAGQKYATGAQYIVAGYIPNPANRRPQFVALHIRKDSQGRYEVARMLAGDLRDCAMPTQGGCEMKGEVMENIQPVMADLAVPGPDRLAGTATGVVEFNLDRVARSAEIAFAFDVFLHPDAP